MAGQIRKENMSFNIWPFTKRQSRKTEIVLKKKSNLVGIFNGEDLVCPFCGHLNAVGSTYNQNCLECEDCGKVFRNPNALSPASGDDALNAYFDIYDRNGKA